jgi:hypothetical protein
MADANLKSQQNGWYNVRDQLTLVCSKRGQAVKGFFSFNIPNNGWDNLWYKTSDGNFVAGAPAAQPTGDRAAQALAWARNQMSANPNNPVQCEVFVEQA